ncbi:TonB-dependent receptor [Pseudotamlana agarivorans]|uniref:TonB-dependent receptor n=1 Tax=Pseudotamlana agarivorans TaxID=481183 RepID=UPI000834F868|nr:TonB-dependent receptor [Tamlana agarivorans]
MRYLIASFLIICFFTTHAQVELSHINGVVTDTSKQPLLGVSVTLLGTNKGAPTNLDGIYTINEIPPGAYTLKVSAMGFKPQELSVKLIAGNTLIKDVILIEDISQLEQVTVNGKSRASKIEEKGFTVNVIETQKLKSQSVEINTVLGHAPGVRVRTTGGIGSDFEYSLDGMSGNAISFFIDGIPMDYFGSSYSINNLPVALIERIDIYKGVVPVDLGSDALGGAINLVTNQEASNFLEASYSFGSFNTHRAALHGQWKAKSGFTTRLSTFYTYSDNNYKVWGQGVYYAEEGTGKAIEFTEDNPAERFNDDFRTLSTKLDLGVTQKKWADQFFVSILASDQKKGVQTGQTMGHVYGEMRNNEQVLMPSLTYQKKDLITKGLNLSAFAGLSYKKEVVIDTTTSRYDWRGEVIGINPDGGEIGRTGKSLYTQKDVSNIYRVNTTYQLPSNFKLGVNYLYTGTNRTGDDPFAAQHKIPYSEPQNISSNFAGLSLETTKFNNRLHANAFIKYYGFNSSINDLVYTTEWEIVKHENSVSNWGGGFATSYKLYRNLLLKASLEQATRLPSATEALGDGVTISNNPDIKPEQSFNLNFGVALGRYDLGANNGLKIELNTFYRNVSDKLQLNVQGGQEIGQFENIRKVSGTGAELNMVLDFNQKLKLSLNGTYLDYRNNLKVDENGNDNIVYGDRLRNTPYLLANANLEYDVLDVFQKDSRLFTYLQSGYVHEFFLRWPSLGSQDSKSVIPTQLVFDAGIGYTFPSQKLILSLDLSNILNEQVYDNFLLQKPGRAIFFKINYKILE